MMTLYEIKQEITRLDVTEKLSLVTDIWDSIAVCQNQLPLSAQQKQQLDERYSAYQMGSESLHDWQTVHRELRARCK